ncbi:uncharacterized protein LOC143623058 [Bidens hawaiensis]|uniref:uncharacterized protein LOC143623058 n=1 Tax=Bidens hawaiensis TaxID=980011 RepID=UPI00404AFABB
MKAYRAKMKSKKKVKGDYKEQYSLLREYATKLVDKNPSSTVKIEVEPPTGPESTTRQFKRIYVFLAALKQGFKALNMDLLGLDGAFMKGTFPGQMLTAVGLDRNNGIYHVCYAIVESESSNSWTWFLELLSEDLEIRSNSRFTFMSDRQKEGQFSDVMINNMCEVSYGKIVEGRDIPIISALENRQITTMCSGMEGLYMRHAVAALWVMDANGERAGALESWVHPVHTMDRWKLVYSFKINPVIGMSMWKKCEASTTIVAPKHHTMVGRPKKARKRSMVEKDDVPTTCKLTRKNTLGACSRCRSTGHNVRTCTCPLKKKGKRQLNMVLVLV